MNGKTVWIKINMFAILLSIMSLSTKVVKAQEVEESYCQNFPEHCDFLTQFYKAHYKKIEIHAAALKLSPSFFLAIVAPEVANFNPIQNELEYHSMSYFYVNWGEAQANFSIGYFQMKPIFVRQLESEIQKRSALKSNQAAFAYKRTDEVEIRRERLERLYELDWQLNYLAIFCKIMAIKHQYTLFKSEADKLAFYAAAYNRGYTHPEAEIRRWIGVKWFPNAGKGGDFAYASVALELWGLIQ